MAVKFLVPKGLIADCDNFRIFLIECLKIMDNLFYIYIIYYSVQRSFILLNIHIYVYSELI